MCAAESRRIMLGELLLRAGVITENQLRSALAEQKKWGGKLGYLLVEMNYLDEDTLVKALSKQLGLPRVDFKGLAIPDPVLKKVKADFAEQRQVLPVSYDPVKNHLLVATADPGDLALADELGFRTGCHVRMAIAGERALARAIRKYYFGDSQAGGPVSGYSEQELNLIVPQKERMQVEPAGDRPAEGGSPPLPGSDPDKALAARTLNGLADKLGRLELLQRKQIRIIKVVVELLIERGYISREEYRQKVEQ